VSLWQNCFSPRLRGELLANKEEKGKKKERNKFLPLAIIGVVGNKEQKRRQL
jgi:hypothetical protein